MPMTKWYQQTWAKYLGALAVITSLGTGVGYLGSASNWWNNQQNIPKQLEKLNKKIDSIISEDSLKDIKIEKMMRYIELKKRSFAVGFRIKKVTNEHTGKERWIKQYRDWKGHLNDIYIDFELTEFHGTDYYYYIDKDSHEKVYCW